MRNITAYILEEGEKWKIITLESEEIQEYGVVCDIGKDGDDFKNEKHPLSLSHF